jgi:hypothetical protein
MGNFWNWFVLILFLTGCGGSNENVQAPPVLGDCMSANALLASYGNPLLKVESADFDGTNDYMQRGADLTGAVDGKSGIFSVWIRIDATGIANTIVTSNSTAIGFYVQLETGNIFQVRGVNAAGTVILELHTANAYTSGWHHVLASWDLSSGVGSLYIDDVLDSASPTLTNDTLDYTKGAFNVGAFTGGAGGIRLNACLADLYYQPNQYLDFSVISNRRKFISPNGKPVALGADGSLPTGTAPIIYLHLDPAEAVADFATNRGTGGNFTITGALTAGSTSPSD